MRPSPIPPAVYPIVDWGAIAGAAEAAPAEQMEGAVDELARGGAEWIQLRAKGVGDSRLYDLAAAACRAAARRGIRLWINDRPDLAALLPVAGVHLGQDDLPPRAARAVVGPDVWIGASTHDAEQVRRAAADDEVDVLAVGPVFATGSKHDPDPVVGLDLVARARRWTDKPLVAIGGIDAGNIGRVLAAGADCAAVIGAVGRPPTGDRLRALTAAAGKARH